MLKIHEFCPLFVSGIFSAPNHLNPHGMSRIVQANTVSFLVPRTENPGIASMGPADPCFVEKIEPGRYRWCPPVVMFVCWFITIGI